MSTDHRGGNIQNEITLEEHDGANNAKRVNVVAGGVGQVTVTPQLAWPDPKAFIGLVTVVGDLSTTTGMTTLFPGPNQIGSVTVSNTVSTTFSGNVTLADAKTYVGLTTSTLGVGTQFIGLVTANSRNAGTTKSLVILPVGLGNNSLATVAVPTNAQKINATHVLLSSNVTTEIAILSGVTYLTGNASLGVTLFPGGGFELPGSPDSPSWIGLPSGAMVIQKRDPGGTVSKIGGHVLYFDE